MIAADALDIDGGIDGAETEAEPFDGCEQMTQHRTAPTGRPHSVRSQRTSTFALAKTTPSGFGTSDRSQRTSNPTRNRDLEHSSLRRISGEVCGFTRPTSSA